MRVFILVAVLFLLNGFTFGQTSFQGTIVYDINASKENAKEVAELTIDFGVNKVKVQLKEKINYDQNYLIIDLDSGKVFNVNTRSKTYRTTKLDVVNPSDEIMPAPKKIAGYETTPFRSDAPGSAGVLAAFYMGRTTLYASNDLYYLVPQKYQNARELIFLHNGHIVLGAQVDLSKLVPEDEDALPKEGGIITVEARSITKGTPEPKTFLIPQDYTKAKPYEPQMDSIMITTDTASMIDSSMMYADTTAVSSKQPVQSKTKTKTKSPTAPKKKTVTKGEAIKPKKN